MLREQWVRYFVSDDEFKQLVIWLEAEGLQRPYPFEERIEHANRLRKLGNEWYGREDWRRALHCALGAVHALDWKPAEQLGHSEEQKHEVAKAMLPLMSNLSMILLKRGDFE